MHFLQLLHLTILSQFKFNSPKKSQYLLYSFNQEPLATTILLRFKFNQYKDHNILVHLGYHLQIPFVTTDPFSIQIRSTKRWQYPRPLPAISMKSSRFPWSNQPEFTPFSRATPKKRNWKRSHLNDKGTIHFCWTAYFLAPCTQTESTRELLASLLSRDANFSSHPSPGQAEITRRVAILVSTSLLVTRPCILANVRPCVCSYIMLR